MSLVRLDSRLGCRATRAAVNHDAREEAAVQPSLFDSRSERQMWCLAVSAMLSAFTLTCSTSSDTLPATNTDAQISCPTPDAAQDAISEPTAPPDSSSGADADTLAGLPPPQQITFTTV